MKPCFTGRHQANCPYVLRVWSFNAHTFSLKSTKTVKWSSFALYISFSDCAFSSHGPPQKCIVLQSKINLLKVDAHPARTKCRQKA